MPIRATCHACGSVFRVPEEHAGKRAKCKNCGAAMQIPDAGPAEDDDAAALPSPWRESEDEIKEGPEYERHRRARRREGNAALQRARKILGGIRLLIGVSAFFFLVLLLISWSELSTGWRAFGVGVFAVEIMAIVTLYRLPLIWTGLLAGLRVLGFVLGLTQGQVLKGEVIWAAVYIGAFVTVRDALRYLESDDSSSRVTSLRSSFKGDAGPGSSRLHAEKGRRTDRAANLRILGLTGGILALVVTAVVVLDRDPPAPPPPPPAPPIDATLDDFETAVEAGEFDNVKAMLVDDYSGNWSNIERFLADKGWSPGGVDLAGPTLQKNREDAPTQFRATYAVPEYDLRADWKSVDGEWRLRRLSFKRLK